MPYSNGKYTGAASRSSGNVMPEEAIISVNMSSTFSHGHASGARRRPSSRFISMSDLHSPTWHTLLMASARCAPSPRRTPSRSGNMAAGSTTS